MVDGRNIWRSDLAAILDRIEPVAARRGFDRVMLAPSCSLLHVPIDLDLETDLLPELAGGLAFAVQKIDELVTLSRALTEGVPPGDGSDDRSGRPSDWSSRLPGGHASGRALDGSPAARDRGWTSRSCRTAV